MMLPNRCVVNIYKAIQERSWKSSATAWSWNYKFINRWCRTDKITKQSIGIKLNGNIPLRLLRIMRFH